MLWQAPLLTHPLVKEMLHLRLGQCPNAELLDLRFDFSFRFARRHIESFATDVFCDVVLFECSFNARGNSNARQPPESVKPQVLVMAALDRTNSPHRVFGNTDLDWTALNSRQQVYGMETIRADILQ
ncbi:hypothetical protein FHS77_003009 [Paenochrobactrum gallinarii]|uniref:Uncharacterized protein n=1 Tax=Paenochrobactrum gallinarii TaxID=643673 RepID=A0A841LVP8_9HYPH|nr:hypothetical protein [Paenochrobactrum gallinarii]MBB6262435.1 hypothetical protein [Paenochrobactrum gallinarii]